MPFLLLLVFSTSLFASNASRVVVGPTASAYKLSADNGKGAKESVNSSLNLGGRVEFSYEVAELLLLAEADLSSDKMTEPAGKSLSEANSVLWGASLGAGFYPIGSKDFQLNFLTRMQQSRVLLTDATGLRMEKYTAPRFLLQADFQTEGFLGRRWGTRLEGLFALGVETDNGANVGNGIGYAGTFWVELDLLDDSALRLGPQFSYLKTDFQGGSQSRTSVGGFAEMSWAL